METSVKLAQHTFTVSHRATLCALVGAVVFLATVDSHPLDLGLMTSAQASERVLILTAGGVSSLERVTVRTTTETPTLSSSSPFLLHLWEGTAATYSDLVVLPGGDLLLGDGSGRGAVFFDQAGEQLDEIFGIGGMTAPSSVVASAFLAPNEPDLLLMGDNSVGRVHLYDLIDRRYEWSQSFILDLVAGEVQRAIRLPEDRIAVAVSWPSLSLSSVQVLTLDSPAEELLSIFSEPHIEAPDVVLLEGLHPVRDIMADIDGRILITSRNQLTLVHSGGAVIWEYFMGQDPGVGGEFQSAHWLESGLIVAATRQPGQWNTPHINHRVHLFDPEADSALLDSSPSFDGAPLRLDVESGHGGTGTRGFYADAFELDPANINDLQVDDGPTLAPLQVARDESAFFEFTLLYTGEDVISLRRTEFRIAQGLCSELNLPDALTTSWWSKADHDLGQNETWTVETLLFPGEFALGSWCGQLAVITRDGTRHFLADSIDFEIFPPAAGNDQPVRVDDLADFGADAGQPADAGAGSSDDDGGCACSSTSHPPAHLSVLFAVFGIWRIRRIRRKKPSFSPK